MGLMKEFEVGRGFSGPPLDSLFLVTKIESANTVARLYSQDMKSSLKVIH